MAWGWNEELLRAIRQQGVAGHSVVIGHTTIILRPDLVHLGNRVRIDPFSLITTGLTTGDNVQICSHVVIGGGARHRVTLGHWSFIGYGSQLFCASEDYSGRYGPVNEYWGGNRVDHRDITFGDYAGVASDVMVMPGVELPEGCLIGAKSFVYRSEQLRPWCVYVGNPLRLHEERDAVAVRRLASDPGFLKSR